MGELESCSIHCGPPRGWGAPGNAGGCIDPEVYEIFAVCRSRIRAGNSDAFSYYRYAGCTDEDTFHEYVAGVRSESIYETDIIPQYGEQLVTLSTCAYHTNEGRFYVVGRRIL